MKLTAIIELSKLLPVFRRAVSDKNLEECKRCIKSYKGIEVNCGFVWILKVVGVHLVVYNAG